LVVSLAEVIEDRLVKLRQEALVRIIEVNIFQILIVHETIRVHDDIYGALVSRGVIKICGHTSHVVPVCDIG
jgi:hypothetical protein